MKPTLGCIPGKSRFEIVDHLQHRAFHALPPLSVSKTGEPTGAVYGFVLMLLKVVQDLKPTHWAIAFDRLGWLGWLQISFFIVVLLISLFYIWKKGGLEWD